jgi:hypothetical protein
MSKGGKRPGAGRKFVYGEPTKRMSIPLSLVKKVEQLLKSKKT